MILNASGTEVQYTGQRRIFEDGNSIKEGNETERNVQTEKRDCLNAKEGMEIEAAVGKGLGSRGHNTAIGVQVTIFGGPWASLSVNSKSVRIQSRQQSEGLNGGPGSRFARGGSGWMVILGFFMRSACFSPAVQDLSG